MNIVTAMSSVKLTKDISSDKFDRICELCITGVHPEVAFKSVGLGNVYYSLLTVAEVMPLSRESAIIEIVSSYYSTAVGSVLKTMHRIATDEENPAAVKAADLFLRIGREFDNAPKPIILRNNDEHN